MGTQLHFSPLQCVLVGTTLSRYLLMFLVAIPLAHAYRPLASHVDSEGNRQEAWRRRGLLAADR